MASSNTNDTRETVLRYLKALGEKDLATVLALAADDIEYRILGDHPLAGVFSGRDQVVAGFFQPMMSLLDMAAPYVTEVSRMITEDEHAVVECVSSSTTKDGRPFRNPMVAILTVKDGKVTQVAEYFDTDNFKRTLFPSAPR
ncbi:nuclear transport factor 2 family protein [Pendulispora rubella]|uniref:Nuclear transport factor 2 family protein n=1 Tax=Pendulispora rubella TaxID=2741070 RepID=A0ABZ2KZN5_9BACT